MGEKRLIVKIRDIKKITHDVKMFRIDKPAGYQFRPGQATEVSINKLGWKNEKRPFTFTCLNYGEHLEFIIKIYGYHEGVTKKIGKLKEGDELIIGEPWGAINYSGKGVFIAGGAGITPFVAILRQLKNQGDTKGNMLIFSNKTESDIILKDELKSILGNDCIFVLTREKKKGFDFGRINKGYLKSKIGDFCQNFYLCGPKGMVIEMHKILTSLGARADSIVFER